MPVLMIGTQRSGSNLLRLMLNQLPDIAAPHPPHILQRMMPLCSHYGDLENNDSFFKLVDDVCQLVELNPVPWEGVTFDRHIVAKRCRNRTLVAVYGAVYDIMAETWGARTWCCKSLANVKYLPEIEAYFTDAKYIYLYRDGRDVAVSFRKAVVGEKHFYNIAQDWAGAQRLALGMRDKIPSERFFSISYESLIASPKDSMRRLCNFLGTKFRASMLNFHKSEEARRAATSSALWGNVVRPIMKNNSNKFLQEATEADIRIFETVAGDVLDALGYPRFFIRPGEELAFSAEDVERFNAENRRLKQETLNAVDTADLERRDRQASFLQEIITRVSQPGNAARPNL